MAASGLALVLGEYWRGDGGDKKHCGAKRFDVSHLPFSGLDNTFTSVGKSDSTSHVVSKPRPGNCAVTVTVAVETDHVD
jgi:hypothetical protein